jgi:hypothetical protein
VPEHYLVSPDRVTQVNGAGEPVQVWDAAELFDRLVWAGCPLCRDAGGEVLIDIELDSTGSPAWVHSTDERMPTTPISDQAASVVAQWQEHP